MSAVVPQTKTPHFALTSGVELLLCTSNIPIVYLIQKPHVTFLVR